MDVNTIANQFVETELPGIIKNINICIPVIYGHRVTNSVIETMFFDTTGDVRRLFIHSTVSQVVTVRIFYIE